jgi:hypothetical protein
LIDNLFNDCNRIANTYEFKLIDVLHEFIVVEESYKRQLIVKPYDSLIKETEDYIRGKHEKL